MKAKFKFYCDPGHGWLAVPIKSSNDVGLYCTAYSRYSYVKGMTLYLEEDCDAPKFLKRIKPNTAPCRTLPIAP